MIGISFYLIYSIKIFVVITCFICIVKLSFGNSVNRALLFILIINSITEITTILFSNIPPKYFTNLNVILTNILWLYILSKFFHNKKTVYSLLTVFLLFSVVNLFLVEGFKSFNYYIFLIGAFLYLYLFIFLSFKKLRIEDLKFLLSNNYTLLFAPILYYFGFSFIFSFKNIPLAKFVVFDDVKLYTIIGFFVNIVYYTFLNVYIYRENKLKRGA